MTDFNALPKANKSVAIRASDETRMKWRQAAAQDGLALNKWIRKLIAKRMAELALEDAKLNIGIKEDNSDA